MHATACRTKKVSEALDQCRRERRLSTEPSSHDHVKTSTLTLTPFVFALQRHAEQEGSALIEGTAEDFFAARADVAWGRAAHKPPELFHVDA